MQDATAITSSFMRRLASCMKPAFPHHGNALLGEVMDTRLTEERWQRVGNVLASLHSIPGVTLSPDEHAVRGIALSAIVVARKMAAANFGSRRPEDDREFAVWYTNELSGRIDKLQQGNATE